MKKRGNKPTRTGLIKMQARYDQKVEEFKSLTIEQLVEKAKEKMSSTDRQALTTCYILKKREAKQVVNQEINGTSEESVETV